MKNRKGIVSWSRLALPVCQWQASQRDRNRAVSLARLSCGRRNPTKWKTSETQSIDGDLLLTKSWRLTQLYHRAWQTREKMERALSRPSAASANDDRRLRRPRSRPRASSLSAAPSGPRRVGPGRSVERITHFRLMKPVEAESSDSTMPSMILLIVCLLPCPSELLFLLKSMLMDCKGKDASYARINWSRSIFSSGLISDSLQTHDGCLSGDGWHGGEGISTSCDFLIGSIAFPDTTGNSLDTVLTAEWRHVGSVLTDLELLHDLSEGGTISSSVLSADSDLSRSLSHCTLSKYLKFNY